MRSRTRELWRNEGLGLTMIGASLLVIGVIVGLLFAQERKLEDSRVRAQAWSLVRLVAALPQTSAEPSVYSANLAALAASQSADAARLRRDHGWARGDAR